MKTRKKKTETAVHSLHCDQTIELRYSVHVWLWAYDRWIGLWLTQRVHDGNYGKIKYPGGALLA